MKTPLEWLRHFNYRYNYTRAPKLNLTKPVDVTLELSSACNLACVFCYHADQKNLPFKKGMMAFKTAQQIIAQAHDLRVPSIKFNWKGESTLNPHFKNILSEAEHHASGYTFQERFLNSNFMFPITNEDIFFGLRKLTKVKVSLDSFIPGVIEKQRVNSNLEKIVNNVSKFYHMPGRKTEIVIQAVRTQLNKDEDLESEVKRRWPSASISIREMVTGRVGKDLENLKVKSRDFSKRKSCVQAHARLVFRHDGQAFPCCVDLRESMPLGNINSVTMKKIWNSFGAQSLRRDLLNKEAFVCEGACKSCSSFESFADYRAPWGS